MSIEEVGFDSDLLIQEIRHQHARNVRTRRLYLAVLKGMYIVGEQLVLGPVIGQGCGCILYQLALSSEFKAATNVLHGTGRP